MAFNIAVKMYEIEKRTFIYRHNRELPFSTGRGDYGLGIRPNIPGLSGICLGEAMKLIEDRHGNMIPLADAFI